MIKNTLASMLAIILSTGLLVIWTGMLDAAPPKETLIIADATGDPSTIDPHMHYNTQLSSMLRQIYETLLDRDQDGKLIPALVESWKSIDKRTWQFILRRGVMFHNDQEVTADDVKFSIDRVMDPKNGSPQRRDYRTINSVEVVDKYTFNIITETADPILPDRLVLFMNILPAECFKKEGSIEFFNHPIGAGPFRFTKWAKGKEITLEANKSYFRGSPQVNKVVFKFISSKEEQLNMLLSGGLDIVTNIAPQFTLKIKQDPHLKLFKKPSVQFFDLFLDTINSQILSDKRIRQALNHATDVDQLIKYVQKGNARRLSTFTMPEEFGYNPNLTCYPFDLNKAAKLLREAGYPNGFKLKLLAMEHLSILSTALSKQWRRIGIDVTLTFKSREEAILRGLIKKEIPFDVFVSDPTDPLFDASHQMTIHLDPKHPICRFHNAEILKLLYEANDTLDQQKRSILLQNIQAIVREEAPIVFLYQNVALFATRADVANFVPYADTMLRLRSLMFKH